jgi:hypothetical protein
MSDGLPSASARAAPIDGRRLAELRRAAAGLERPEDGIFLRVEADGRAIATGPKGKRIPEAFRRFARDNGLSFFAGRRLPKYAAGTPAANISGEMSGDSEPMLIDYRESGALYFGETRGGESLDRTDSVLFSRPKSESPTSRDAKQPQGRAQPLSAKVLTPSGYRPMGDIEAGDEVIAADGSATEVMAVFPQGMKPIYRITLSDGSTTRSTLDHLWMVREEGQDEFKVLPLSEILPGVAEDKRYEIPALGDGPYLTKTGICRYQN